jgi:gamma-glutamyltranspeptidase/glutathione hydrolase
MLQVAEVLGAGDHDPASAAYHHAVAQAFRLAMADRSEQISDPSVEDVPLDALLDRPYAEELAGLVPEDGFVDAEEADSAAVTPETDTTHVVVVDREGTMVSMTNTLSNFFGSGLVVDGFFMNDQLKNFSADADSVNAPAPGKRPRSFITPANCTARGSQSGSPEKSPG